MRNKLVFVGIAAVLFAVAAIGARSDKVKAPRSDIVHHTKLSGKVDIPDKINYQGYLTDANGNPIDGQRNMRFSIWDQEQQPGGNELWFEDHSNVDVENGLFNVILGSVNPILGGVFPSGGSRWLETQIEGEILSPRKEIVSVAYAFKADTADYAIAASADNDWQVVGTNMHSIPTGKVGIGTTSPTAKLTVYDSSFPRILSTDGTASTIIQGEGGWGFVGNVTPHNLALITGNVNRLVIDRQGKVGIGTESPLEELDVVGDIHATGTITSGSSVTIDGVNDKITATSGIIDFDDENLITAGNVGIGIPSPAEKLDVDGTVQMTGFKMPTDASNGYVLTSDASGVGTWQAATGGYWTQTGNSLYPNNTGWRVGIGTSSPSSIYSLDVIGQTGPGAHWGAIHADANGSSWAIRAEGSSGQQGAVWGLANGADYGVRATGSSGGNAAVWGGANGADYGVWGRGSSGEFAGVYGEAYGATWGVYALGDIGCSGTVEMASFKMPTGASNGYVLTSDGNGVGTWQAAPGGADNDWTVSGNDMYSAVSGNVGIGTTSPLWKFDVHGEIRARDQLLASNNDGAISLTPSLTYSTINAQRNFPGVQPADIALATNGGNVGIGITTPSVPLDVRRSSSGANQVVGLFSNPSDAAGSEVSIDLEIGTTWPTAWRLTGTSSNLQIGNAVVVPPAMTIGSGNVGIGTTTPTAGYKLDVIGKIRCESVTQYSSKDYKKDIQAMAPSDYLDILEKLSKTDIFRFRYKTDEENSKLRIGLIAESAPEEVISEEGKGIDLGKAVGFLVAAVKAQQEEIEKLRAELNRSKGADNKLGQ